MKPRFYFLAATLVLLNPLFLSHAQTPNPGAKPEAVVAPYAVLDSFIGGVWSADLPGQNGGVGGRIEMHFSWLENKQGLRFDSTFIQGNKSAPYTSGVYVWNAAKRKLQILYTDSSGSLSEGMVAQDGEVLVHDLSVTHADASVESVRVRLTKAGTNAFTNEIFVFRNKAWTRIVEARYQRFR